MPSPLCLIFLPCLVLVSLSSAATTTVREDGHELLSVIVVFRHGDRTPIDMYPTDPYKDVSNWPVGFGELTPRGKMMQFHLGQFIRQRYVNFLNETYSEKELFVRSSDMDRTLMSAMSNLAGLFPPKGNQVWNPDLLWQPIPVHTLPIEEDNIISNHANCPKFDELIEKVANDPVIVKIIDKYQWVFEYLTEHTGANVTNLFDIDYLYDTFFIETVYNKTLPEWTKKVYPDHMEEMKDLSFKLSTWTHELKRLRGGPIVQSIIDHFRGFIASENTYKLVMYSGHDTTVSALLNTLGLFDPPIGPPYASMVIAELTRFNQSYYVNFAYRNDSSRDPHLLTIPSCGSHHCPLEKFDSITEDLRPYDWAGECGLNVDATVKAVTVFSIGVSLVLATILIVSVIISCIRRLSRTSDIEKQYQYLAVDSS